MTTNSESSGKLELGQSVFQYVITEIDCQTGIVSSKVVYEWSGKTLLEESSS